MNPLEKSEDSSLSSLGFLPSDNFLRAGEAPGRGGSRGGAGGSLSTKAVCERGGSDAQSPALPEQVPALNSESSLSNRRQAEEECHPNLSSVLDALRGALAVLG